MKKEWYRDCLWDEVIADTMCAAPATYGSHRISNRSLYRTDNAKRHVRVTSATVGLIISRSSAWRDLQGGKGEELPSKASTIAHSFSLIRRVRGGSYVKEKRVPVIRKLRRTHRASRPRRRRSVSARRRDLRRAIGYANRRRVQRWWIDKRRIIRDVFVLPMDKEREEGRHVRWEAQEPLFGRQESWGVWHSTDFAKCT